MLGCVVVGGTGGAVEVEGGEGGGDLGDFQLVHVGEGGVQGELVEVGLEVIGVDACKDDGDMKGFDGDEFWVGRRGEGKR